MYMTNKKEETNGQVKKAQNMGMFPKKIWSKR